MTHFVGMVIGNSDESPDELLAPFSENLDVPRYMCASRAEAIARGRERIANYASPSGPYGEYLADPAKYIERMIFDGKISNPSHLKYLVAEFPAQLTWTDDEVWEHEARFEDDVDAAGNFWSTYNPDSIWDWWVVGGRWDGDHAPFNLTTVARYRAKVHAELDYEPPRVLVDRGGALRRGTEGWWGFTHDDVTALAWRDQVLERLSAHDDTDEVLFVDLHI